MANFKGFKQTTLESYLATSVEDRKNYLWLVRNLGENQEVLSAAIYFGNRKYAELNDDAASTAEVENIKNALGELVDENGEWVGFLPFDEHELLGNSGITSVADALSVLEAAILANADAIAGKVSQADYEEKVAELEEAIEGKVSTSDYEAKVAELEDKIDEVTEQAITAITEDIEAIKEELNEKADATDVEAVSAKTNELEESLSAVTQLLDEKVDASDVYTKDQVYTKDEVNAKVAGVFHFKDNAVSISDDETTITLENGDEVVASEENNGYVYQIGDAEYASNGSKWVKLGFNQDMTDFATKEYVDSALTAESEAREALADDLADTQEALAQEIQAREDLAEEVEEVKNNSTLTAATFSDAEEMDLNLGQIVYVTTEETVSGITYIPGAYIYTQDGLKKLDSTTPSTSTTLEQRVESLENNVGGISTLLGNESFEGDSLTEAVAALQNDSTHLIDGDDVEE